VKVKVRPVVRIECSREVHGIRKGGQFFPSESECQNRNGYSRGSGQFDVPAEPTDAILRHAQLTVSLILLSEVTCCCVFGYVPIFEREV
jgi:hypothetical protein